MFESMVSATHAPLGHQTHENSLLLVLNTLFYLKSYDCLGHKMEAVYAK